MQQDITVILLDLELTATGASSVTVKVTLYVPVPNTEKS